MFRLPDRRLVLSATDLTSYLACGHLIEQKRAVALGERVKWRKPADPHGELTKTRGDEHERAQLERLSAELGGHVDLSPPETRFTREWLVEQAARTYAAMRDGAPLIFQGLLFDGRWQGRVDFLRRVEIPSALGAHSYEVLDSKLARQVKPAVVHQLALYTRLLGEAQGFHPPAAFVILGDGVEHAVELERYRALHRHVARRLEALIAAGPAETYPEPTAHCGICDLDLECSRRRRADDHLSLVAGARRDQRGRLVELGITKVHELAAAPEDRPAGKLGAERFGLLRHQAALQVATWADGGRHHRHLPAAFDRGYARLPEPDAGDVFFDLEGDPYVGTDGGIEYLWGWCTAEGAYACTWAHNAEEEKAALERFVDFVVARRRAHPHLHVFHYAPHEASKLRSLALKYATREDEVDQLLRDGVLVDLYAVVRQGMQVGEESYGLKRLERHTGFERGETTVREGGGSIVAYEHWLESREPELLEAIRAYNADDCRSTLRLRDWLLDPMKPEAAAQLPCDFAALVAPEANEYEPTDRDVRLAGIAERLAAGLSADGEHDDAGEAERRLLSHLMLFHKREAKPEWWRFFEVCDLTPEQLIDERDAIGGLEPDPRFPPVVATKQSTDWSFAFPPQEFKLDGVEYVDPATGKGLNVQLVEDDRVVIRRRTKDGLPTARAVIGGGALRADALRDALAALGEAVLDGEPTGAAARSILRREAPRLASGRAFAQDGDPEIEEMIATALDLRDSHLVVQGPPGTGKTYRGARMVVAAIRAGRRVAVTAPSHAAVQNLLRAVEDAAAEAGVEFTGVYKGGGYDSPYAFVESVGDNPGTVGDFDLVAGTAWLLAREEHHGQFDLLFIDEAGQFSLANAAAVALCASSAVLLGDPQQLPQVTQASHPGTSGRSVLAHLLGGRNTVAADRGYLLTESWRMHPAVCEYVSERSYDGLLRSREACARRAVSAAAGALGGAGLRVLPVAHEGRSQSSVEEARAIGAACRDLLAGGTVTDEHGDTRGLVASDLMVVAPYNLAVRCVREHVPAGVAVGTVDKFQGQEAPVVFFAMTCSSGEDVPRGLDFLFDRNRMNVAVSRAQCLAVLVHSPRLLDADCRTLEAMELVDGACRFVELASRPGGPAAGAVAPLAPERA
jgi:predicted RecB family nuclease